MSISAKINDIKYTNGLSKCDNAERSLNKSRAKFVDAEEKLAKFEQESEVLNEKIEKTRR